MRAILALLLLCFSVLGHAQTPASTNRYFELCVVNTDFCAIGVVDTFNGEFRVVVRNPVAFNEDPGMRVEAVGDKNYDYMKKYSLAHIFKTKEDLARTPEEQEILDEQAENVGKCLVLAAGCAVSIVDAIGTAGLASAVAVLACTATMFDCKAVRRANLALEARRQEVLKKVKEEQQRKQASAPAPISPPEWEPGMPRPPSRPGVIAGSRGPQRICREVQVGGRGTPTGSTLWPKELICGWQ